MIDGKLRAWWSYRQALDGRLVGRTAAEILSKTGWSRSVGGVGPYLTLYSRGAIGRETADEHVRTLEIHELPSARGCTYVVPATDFALALKSAQSFGGGEMKIAEKLGVKPAEIDKLSAAVISALANGALDPAELRETLGSIVRNLGEEGKKKGLTTTLPVALGKLQTEGEIRRVPINGRLDQQRYRYVLWRPNPLAGCHRSTEECSIELARRYFEWIGPATLAEFQWFSGLGVNAAKAALAPLKLEALITGEDRLLLPQHRDTWEAFHIPKDPHYSLVSSLDGISLLRRNVKNLVLDNDLERKVPVEKGRAALGTLSDLPSHAILDRGRVIGLWEYEPASESIAWMTFASPDKALKKAVAATEEYVRNGLGDARSFSLDSPSSRAPRIAALRAAMA
jgi:hypothetical protein